MNPEATKQPRCAICDVLLTDKLASDGATTCGNDACAEELRLREEYLAWRSHEMERPQVPVTERERARRLQWKAVGLIAQRPRLREWFVKRIQATEDNPYVHLGEIESTPLDEPLSWSTRRFLRDRIRSWKERGANPAELAGFGLVRGRGETSPLEELNQEFRDDALLDDVLIQNALGATVDDAARVVVDRFKTKFPKAFRERGVKVETLMKKFGEIPHDDLTWFLREMGENVIPDDVREYLAQFPDLEKIISTDLKLEWRERGYLPKRK